MIRTILGHNFMRMQADFQAKKIFQCGINGKNVLRVMASIGNQERCLGPKLMLIIFNVLIIINYTIFAKDSMILRSKKKSR